ncbi:uncharacterized protein LOC126671632 [Mercurialis annua]|uniref:uncharacterized protein LOC126671632 n=1 Tax=Mercurialis annua TaxID=3986 RepID=UPI00215EB9B2|nr:uncharacterized protein LOC126671632 [Mercurialis annua]
MDSAVTDNQPGPWTDEKHLHYLNSMEAAFVRTMLENSSHHLRLDRHMPDSSESTLDLKSKRPKNRSTSDQYSSVDSAGTRIIGRNEQRTRRFSSHNNQSHRHHPSQDQVVPHFEKRSGEKDERNPDERDGLPYSAS